MTFDSKADCVEYMASLLGTKYLTDGGRLYSGKTARDVAVSYTHLDVYKRQYPGRDAKDVPLREQFEELKQRLAGLGLRAE